MWVWRSEQSLPVLVFTARARRVYVSCAEPCRQQRSGGVHVSASTVKQHVLHRRLNAQRRFVEDRDVSAGSRVSPVRSRFRSEPPCSGLGVLWLLI